MPKIRTHYDTLHVPRDASIGVIQAAYRSLAHQYHPDRRGASPESHAAMQALNAAYDALSNPVTRAEHDRWIESELGSDSPAESSPGPEAADPTAPSFGQSRPSRAANPISTTRAVLSALLSAGYFVITLTLIVAPGARIVGVAMLIAGWFYYVNHRPRHRR